MQSRTVGFVGQGFIGRNYADDFEKRGFSVIRYSLEEPFVQNKTLISTADFVFVAVPTPSTPTGFDSSIVKDALTLVGEGKVAIIKSTLMPGTTRSLQKDFPHIKVLHSPEFLSEVTAPYDAAHPHRNIVGIVDESQRDAAVEALKLMAPAPYQMVCSSEEAELIKYARNCVGFMRVIFYNMLYDIAETLDAKWAPIAEAVAADPDNGPTYTQPIHKSGRGAGGHCFIKDMAAFRQLYESLQSGDTQGIEVLRSLEKKNQSLLLASNKDTDLLEGVYGPQ